MSILVAKKVRTQLIEELLWPDRAIQISDLVDLRESHPKVTQGAAANAVGYSKGSRFATPCEHKDTLPHISYRRKYVANYLIGLLELPRDLVLKICESEVFIGWRWEPLSPEEELELFAVEEIYDLPILDDQTPLVGRDDQYVQIKRLIFGEQPQTDELAIVNNTIALQGMAGVGKTRLAWELCHDQDVISYFKNAVCWVDLGKNTTKEQAILSLADKLKCPTDEWDKRNPEGLAYIIKRFIGLRRCLIVINDAWELDHTKLLRVGGPNCCHIVTTRNEEIAREFVFNIQQVVSVLPLYVSIPPSKDDAAYELLHTLTPTVCDIFPDETLSLTAAIGGLPLALIVLGGYLKVKGLIKFPYDQKNQELARKKLAIADESDVRLKLAASRLEQLEEIRRGNMITIEDIICLSLNELEDDEQQVFYNLGAFAPRPNSFTPEAAIYVTNTDIDTLAELADRNLIETVENGKVVVLHQVLADFARTNTWSESNERHWDYYLAIAKENREDWEQIEKVYGQIQWAWNRAKRETPDDVSMLNFIWALDTYQRRRGLWEDRLNWEMYGLQLCQLLVDPQYGAKLIGSIGVTFWDSGRNRQAIEIYNSALSLLKHDDDSADNAILLSNIGQVYSDLGEMEHALDYFNRALSLMEQVGNRADEATALNNIGRVYYGLGEKERALGYYNRALPLRKQFGNKAGEAATLNILNGNRKGANA